MAAVHRSGYRPQVDVSLRETKSLAEREAYTIGTVRYPRIIPKDKESGKHIKKHTLTNLYNQRPTGSPSPTKN